MCGYFCWTVPKHSLFNQAPSIAYWSTRLVPELEPCDTTPRSVGVLQKQTAAWRGEINAPGQELTLGMNRSNPSAKEKDIAFEGTLDEICLFKRALTEAEVKDVISMTKPKFTKQQVVGRLRQLRLLFEEGLLTDGFYNVKVAECEAGQ